MCNYSVKNKIMGMIFFLLSYTMVIFATESLRFQTQIKMFTRIIILAPGIFLIIRFLRLPKDKFLIILMLVFLSFLCVINGFENITHTLDFLALVYIVLLIDISDTIDLFYKSTLWGTLLALITIILLVNFGFLENKMYVDNLGRIRNSYGFFNTNSLALYAFSFSIFLYLYKKSKISLLISTLVMLITFYITGSRTPFFSFLLFLFLVIFFKKGNIALKRKINIFLVIIILLFYIYLAVNYQNYTNINYILSGRPSLIYKFFSNLSLRELIFGGNLFKVTIDNAYILLLKFYGILFLILFFLILNHVREHRPHELAFIISMLIYGLFEGVLASPAVPVSSLFWYLTLFGGQTSPKTTNQNGS